MIDIKTYICHHPILHDRKKYLDSTVLPVLSNYEVVVGWFPDAVEKAKRKITAGELSLYMKHLNTFVHIAERSDTCLILEDDTRIPDDFEKIVADCLRAMEDGGDICYIGAGKDTYHAPGIGAVKVLDLKPIGNRNTHCYLLSPAGAKKFLESENRLQTYDLPIDKKMVSIIKQSARAFNVFFHEPGIEQMDWPSTLRDVKGKPYGYGN